MSRYKELPHRNVLLNTLSFGAWPETARKTALKRAIEACRLLAQGIDPAAARNAERAAQANTFKVIAEEWMPKQLFGSRTLQGVRSMLDRLVYPYIGNTPVRVLTPPVNLDVLGKPETRGNHEPALRVGQKISQVIRYAIATGRAESDPTRDLRDALTPVKTTHRAAITEPTKVGGLLRAIDGYQARDPSTHAALKLAPLVFVRPGELRGAEWSEIDLDGAEWRIPVARMKMREPHLVPLSTQAVKILRDLQPITGGNRLVFPSLRARTQPISENTMSAALRRMGFAPDEMSTHGFRAMASTLLNEQGWSPDIIELQLAHRRHSAAPQLRIQTRRA